MLRWAMKRPYSTFIFSFICLSECCILVRVMVNNTAGLHNTSRFSAEFLQTIKDHSISFSEFFCCSSHLVSAAQLTCLSAELIKISEETCWRSDHWSVQFDRKWPGREEFWDGATLCVGDRMEWCRWRYLSHCLTPYHWLCNALTVHFICL